MCVLYCSSAYKLFCVVLKFLQAAYCSALQMRKEIMKNKGKTQGPVRTIRSILLSTFVILII